MSDKIRIISGQLGDFSTAPWGCLKVVDGKATLDKVKCFNRARRMLNAGANTIRVLRKNIWSSPVLFDINNENYWPLFRDYLSIVHQPYQNGGLGAGADIWVEIFDNCSDDKYWMYDPVNYDRARNIIRAMFSNLGDLPYVKFGVGNEISNPGDPQFGRAFVRDCVYPEFKAVGRVPFAYGASYIRQNPLGIPGPLEWQKREAEAAWDEPTALSIYRPVHGVRDANSPNLIDTVKFWVAQNNPICVIWSVDGVWDGMNECDRTIYNGREQVRPSVEQIRSAMKYWMTSAPGVRLPSGQIKYGFEYIGKKPNDDECVSQGIKAISEAYHERWGNWPENWGKYPDDLVEPKPPIPPIPPTPPDCKCRHWLTEPKRPDIWRWIKCLFGGKKRCK